MSNPLEAPRQKEKLPIPVMPGVTFHISPDLNGIERIYGDGSILVETIPLVIRRGGKGNIKILKVADALDESYAERVRTPAGPVEVKCSISNGEITPVIDQTFPFTVELELFDLPEARLRAAIFRLTYGSESFDGVPEKDFVDSDVPEEYSKPARLFFSFIDLKDNQECSLQFPPATTDFGQMDLTIAFSEDAFVEYI